MHLSFEVGFLIADGSFPLNTLYIHSCASVDRSIIVILSLQTAHLDHSQQRVTVLCALMPNLAVNQLLLGGFLFFWGVFLEGELRGRGRKTNLMYFS